jgi:hypothetical protein
MFRELARSIRHRLKQQALHFDPLPGAKAGASVLNVRHTSGPETSTPFESGLGESGQDSELAEFVTSERRFVFRRGCRKFGAHDGRLSTSERQVSSGIGKI